MITAGNGTVDLPAALRELRDRDVKVVLCEGGPTLNTELLRARLIDELCLTIAPLLTLGDRPRGSSFPPPTTRPCRSASSTSSKRRAFSISATEAMSR